MKKIMNWMLAAILICGASVFTSCVENIDNPTPAQPVAEGDIVIPEDPTDDQMEVNVNADLLTAAISDFDDNSMASALLKRIPLSLADVSPDTKFVLLKGDDLFSVTNETWKAIAMVYLKGGFVAIERPTNERLLGFTFGLMAAVQFTLEDLLGENDGGAAARAMTDDLQRRISNARALTRSAADDDDPLAPDKVSMEMIILSPYGIYSQTTFNKEQEVTITITDENGVETQSETVIENKLDAYHYGKLADGAAAWLNEKAISDEGSPAAARAFTRSDAQKAINEAMTCSDEFTISHPLNVIDLDGTTRSFDNKGTTVIKAWSIYDFEKDQDYYYVQESVHLALGGKNADASKTLYWGPYNSDTWHIIKSGTEIDRKEVTDSYGAWMSGTNHRLTLKGSGTIDVVSSASNPAAGKDPSTQSVPVTSESGNWCLGSPAATDIKGGFGWGYSSSSGSSYTSAFSMTNSTINDALKFTKDISGSEVAFNYEQATETASDFIYHWVAPDVMTNDFDVTNTVCWRVGNPSEQYSLEVAGRHQMLTHFIVTRYGAKYLMNFGVSTDVSGSFTLKQPGRYLEKWYCQINTEGENMVADASVKLRSHLQKTIHPDLFQESFNTGETKKGETSVMANGYIYIKSLMEEKRKAIDALVWELGIQHYEIKWYTDDPTTRIFSIEADILNLQDVTSDVVVQDGDILTGTLANNVKISIADGAKVTLNNVTINGTNDNNYPWAGLECLGDATIILADGTTNNIKGFHENYPGISVNGTHTLTIQGNGTLNASSNGKGAGIGGGWLLNCGSIVIDGGTINATGGEGAAGIGGGYNATCDNITINGGNVTATGGESAAGIGTGKYGTCLNITIENTVGVLKATRGDLYINCIGKGLGGTCGTVTIFGTVYPDGITQNQYTYAPGFSVNGSGTLIHFAPGNLQATYENYEWTWHFAEHQWDYIGNATANNKINGIYSVSENGTVDLFAWSMDNPTPYCYGIRKTNNGGNIPGNFVDWGTIKWISGYNANTWRTLSVAEWQYLFNTRTGASQKYASATVNNVHGLVLLPDVWTLPTECSFIAGMGGWSRNVYDATQWASMEANGAVFLPAASRIYWDDYFSSKDAGKGFYYTSTSNTDDYNWAYYLQFEENSLSPSERFLKCSYHCSVRLVR